MIKNGRGRGKRQTSEFTRIAELNAASLFCPRCMYYTPLDLYTNKIYQRTDTIYCNRQFNAMYIESSPSQTIGQ